MKQPAQFLQQVANATLAGAGTFNRFIFRLLSRVSQPAVIFGLIYWVTIRLTGYPMNILPWWWNSAWPIIQAIAITTHLAILPGRAIEQIRAGERAKFVPTLIALIFLAASSILLVGQFDTPLSTSVRMFTLLSILFTDLEPSRDLIIGVVGIAVGPDESDDDEYPFSNPARVQD